MVLLDFLIILVGGGIEGEYHCKEEKKKKKKRRRRKKEEEKHSIFYSLFKKQAIFTYFFAIFSENLLSKSFLNDERLVSLSILHAIISYIFMHIFANSFFALFIEGCGSLVN